MPRIINDDEDGADLFEDSPEISDEEAAEVLGGGHPKSRPPYAPDAAEFSRSPTTGSPFGGDNSFG